MLIKLKLQTNNTDKLRTDYKLQSRRNVVNMRLELNRKGHATRNDIVDDIVDFSSSTMAFNVAKIASARASLTISLTKSLRVAGP